MAAARRLTRREKACCADIPELPLTRSLHAGEVSIVLAPENFGAKAGFAGLDLTVGSG
jgi:hypothetical protein